jgi:hypothetical protein
VAFQNRLHGRLAQAQNLSATLCKKFLAVERKPHFLGVVRHDESDGKRTLSVE